MNVTLAYIEEPPFGWTGEHRVATGADVELAETVLHAIGVTRIEYRLTTFGELLPGVREGRWDMNVPLFVTAERSEAVAFSVPVWGIGDGLLVRSGNPKALDGYAAVAALDDARLGIIAGQVQHDVAKAAGVRDDQVLIFEEQREALDALRSGVIDAYASTALGNRIVADRIGLGQFDAVACRPVTGTAPSTPLGAFSFSKSSRGLLDAVNTQLRAYVGSPDHLARMAKYGLGEDEIEPALRAIQAARR
ncbi:transporter substrate-binding domain-containing protein [Trinickia sp. NRRL B-1857]|uniref:transporter substrate-binding domain-containing protein n=1 Tax=Trinickia sp. NRRL B-1857 TaxID=3162879 RepID=UPI003D2B1789